MFVNIYFRLLLFISFKEWQNIGLRIHALSIKTRYLMTGMHKDIERVYILSCSSCSLSTLLVKSYNH